MSQELLVRMTQICYIYAKSLTFVLIRLGTLLRRLVALLSFGGGGGNTTVQLTVQNPQFCSVLLKPLSCLHPSSALPSHVT